MPRLRRRVLQRGLPEQGGGGTSNKYTCSKLLYTFANTLQFCEVLESFANLRSQAFESVKIMVFRKVLRWALGTLLMSSSVPVPELRQCGGDDS